MDGFLKRNGVIKVESAKAFIAAAKEALAQGGLGVASKGDWPLRQMRTFVIEVTGVAMSVEIRAEVVFASGGNVGLQLDPSRQNRHAIENMIEAAERSLAKETAPAAPPPHQAAVPPPAMVAPPSGVQIVYVHESPPGGKAAVRIQGTVVASHRADEFTATEPIPLDENSCREITLLQLVRSIVVSRQPLALQVSAGGKDLCFQFNSAGKLVQFTGPDSDKNLIDRLVSGRFLQREQARSLLAKVKPEKPADVVLFENQAVKSWAIWNALRDQTIDAFENIRAQDRSPFRLERCDTPRGAGVSFAILFAPWIDRALGSLAETEVDRILAPYWAAYPAACERAQWPLASLELEKRFGRFVRDLVDGRRTLREALAVCPPFLKGSATRLAAGLAMIGTLTFSNELASAAGELSAVDLFKREVDELAKKSCFEQLGVHWTSHPSEFEPALEKIHEVYGPSCRLARESKEGASLCQKRIELAKTALELLKDRKLRCSRREEVVNQFQRQAAAELLFAQAESVLLKQEIQLGRRLIEVAIELDPKPEYQRKLENLGDMG